MEPKKEDPALTSNFLNTMERKIHLRSQLFFSLVIFLSLACLLVHIKIYLPFIADDALISLRYTQRLLQGHGLTWTDGTRVEGYSNLLWVLLCALPGLIKQTPEALIQGSRILGFFGMSAAIAAICTTYKSRASSLLPVFMGSLMLALSGPIAVWAIGGLEQALVAALLAWALVLSYPLLEEKIVPRQILLPAFLLGLLAITRPDGILFAVALTAGVFLGRATKKDFLKVGWLLLIPSLFFGIQLLFRIFYYHDWVPNTAHVKLTLTSDHLKSGLHYLSGSLRFLTGAWIIALLGVIVSLSDTQSRKRLPLLLLPFLSWALYVAVIGGDIFPARRHLVPLLVIMALLAAEGLQALCRQSNFKWGWSVGLASLFFLVMGQMQDPENRRAIDERWEWDGQVVGNVLKETFPPTTLLAVDPAGCVPFFSGLPAIDMLGLNDRQIAKNHPADFGHGPLGHELGDGAYVLSRKPDLILFCLPTGSETACFRSGREMQADPRFYEDYQLMTLEGRKPYFLRFKVWIRKSSLGALGLHSY